eukprot:4594626-Amphidinium_carterae.1
MRVPKGDLVTKRAKCWTCGQIGHFSSACPQRSAGSGSRSNTFASHGSHTTGPPKSFFIGFTSQDAKGTDGEPST